MSEDPFPAEMQAIKDLLKNLIQASTDVEHIKTHIRYALGLQGEMPEMTQLHNMIVQYDKKFDRVDRELRLIKWALAALATVIPGAQVVLSFLGIGG